MPAPTGAVLDPRAGEDTVFSGAGNDTIELRDGAVDRFSTGTGTDTFFRDGMDIRLP